MRNLASSITALMVLNYLRTVHGSVSESDFIPFSESAGNSRFRFGDDNAIHVGFVESSFKFLGISHSSIYISGNGLLSFGQGHTNTRAPDGCVPTPIPMIIPLWSDANEAVDPEGSMITYRETTNEAYLSKISRDIRKAFPAYRSKKLSWMFVVTWKSIAPHAARDNYSLRHKRNTFQVILASSRDMSFVLFYYNQITWGEGALAGFEYGSLQRTYKLPGACTNSILNIAHASNMNVPGKFAFQVDQTIVPPGSPAVSESECSGKSSVTIEPQVVSIMGNVPLIIRGLCKPDEEEEERVNVTCVFLDQGVMKKSTVIRATVLPEAAICQVPFLYSLGRINLNILVSSNHRDDVIHRKTIYVVKEHEYTELPSIYMNKMDKSYFLSAQWNPALLDMSTIVKLDSAIDEEETTSKTIGNCLNAHNTVEIVLLEFDGKKWNHGGPITPSILNNGAHMSPVNASMLNSLLPRKGKILLKTFALEVKHVLRSGESIKKLLAASSVLVSHSLYRNVESLVPLFQDICQSWVQNEGSLPLDTLVCPRLVEQARLDWRFGLETAPHLHMLNAGASAIYTQLVPSPSFAAIHCSYDQNGRLISLLPTLGRVFRISPNSVTGYWKHFLVDIFPYMYCCKWSGNGKEGDGCNQYYAKRPMDLETDYISPRPFRAVGNGHLTTFDGLSYTFNGAGEYWLAKFNDGDDYSHNYISRKTFKAQIRMEPFEIEAEFGANASVITAVVMEEISSTNEVKVQVGGHSEERMSILVDHEPLSHEGSLSDSNTPWNYKNQFILYHSGVVVILPSQNEALVVFSSGFAFNLKMAHGENQGAFALNIVGVAEPENNKLHGLLGNFDGIVSNEYKLPNGTQLHNLTAKEIHEKFGASWEVGKDATIFEYPPGKSYADFSQSDFIPWLFSPEEVNMTLFENQTVCEDSKECAFDYLATMSESIASSTKLASNLFQDIVALSNEVVQQCNFSHELTMSMNFHGTSRVIGSTVYFTCNDTELEQNFKCIKDGTSSVSWIDVATNKTVNQLSLSSLLTCNPEIRQTHENNSKKDGISEIPETKHDNIDKDTVIAKVYSKKTFEHSASQSSVGFWFSFLIGIFILAGVIAVLVLQYPPCQPVKNYFTVSIRGEDVIMINPSEPESSQSN